MNKLADIRRRKGFSQQKFGNVLGVSKQMVSSWENYKYRIDPKHYDKIKRIFGLSEAELLSIVEDTEFTPEINRQNELRERRALRRGESFRTIDDELVEAFRKKAIEAVIMLDIDPAAKNAVLQIINQL